MSETPEQLVERVDRLYLNLASIYVRMGRLLGISPRPVRRMKPASMARGRT